MAALFYIFAALTLAGAIGVVTARHIVRAAIYLLLALLGVAGLYFLLDAEFLAAAQLVIYVGGTLVLLIFGVMLTSSVSTRLLHVTKGEFVIVALAACSLLGGLVVAIRSTTFVQSTPQHVSDPAGHLGRALLTDYLVPFEIASVLMLAVMIGAAYLARRRPKGDA